MNALILANPGYIHRLIRDAASKAVPIVIDALGVEHAGKGVYLRVYHLPKIEDSYVGLIEIFAGWVAIQTSIGPKNT